MELRRNVVDRVAKCILRYNMLPRDARVGVAVSGGADSMCLLAVLRELQPRYGWQLEVAHFNHKLRGEESDRDEEFVKEQAGNLPFHRGEADVRSAGGNLEQEARRARRNFLLSLKFDRVALGHTLDDQAETVLFRFLRGAHTAGLAGILPVTREGFVRPLLDIRREEAREFLRERAMSWREDRTNADLSLARNRIRQELLPALRSGWNPKIDETLAHLAEIAADEERYWTEKLARIGAGGEIPVSKLRGLPRAVARRIILRLIEHVKGDRRGIEFKHVEAVLDLAGRVEGSGGIQLPGLQVLRSFDLLRFDASQEINIDTQRIQAPGEYPAPDGKSRILLELVETDCARLVEDADIRLAREPLELRGWRAGDRFPGASDGQERKLKDLFQAAHVPSWRRATWPIILVKGKVVWAREFGVAGEFRAKNRGRALRIREISV